MDAGSLVDHTTARSGSANQIVEVEHLSFGFESPVIEDLSFTVSREQFVSFIGPSGCGKTTLLYLLLGLRRGHEGSIRVSAGSVSFVFQHDSLLEWRDALENVLLPLELRGERVTAESRARAEAMLELVGIGGQGHLFPAELSGGMKKRVEIARALITEPELLVLDEPFSSLDILSRERLNLLVKKIHIEKRTTVIMVTHSVEEACFLSDRVYVLSNRPARLLKVETIRRHSRSVRDQFSLTPQELAVNSAIRAHAKELWSAGQELAERNGHRTERAARAAGDEPPNALRQLTSWIRGRAKQRYNLILIPFELVALFFLVAFIKLRFQVPDFVFPTPLSILERFFQTLGNGSILPDLGATIYESAVGFAIALGLTLLFGYLVAKSKLLSNLVMPYLIALNTIPSVALAPFLVLWLGFGMAPKIVTCVIVMFFPMLINNIEAIALASVRLRTLVRFYHPGRFLTFVKFELPGALPMIASGIKVSITLSVIGAVVGEFVSGHRGLGSLVNEAKASFDPQLMFVGLLWLSLLGLAYFGIASGFFALVQSRRRAPRRTAASRSEP